MVLVLRWSALAEAQSCEAETRALEELHRRMRADVMSHQAAAAVATWSRHQLEMPAGYSFEQSPSCQAWSRTVANDLRFGCELERAQDQLEEVQRRQAITTSEADVRADLAQVARRASAHFSCPGAENLYLVCRPHSEAAPDAWCARRIEHDMTLEFPLDAACKVVDADGADVMQVQEGEELTCPEASQAYEDAERSRVRAARRASVAAMGTFVALMAAAAVPSTFVPLGFASLFRRLDVLGEDRYEQLRHNSYRARVRYLPLIGMTALSVSSLSSRFWWAGVLTAGCGISADVLLADHWRNGDDAKRAIGIATASLASVAGLVLDIETLSYSDLGTTRLTFMPTLQVGVARLELGLGGRF